MRVKVNAMMPCATFFSAGRVVMGIATLAMQASLVLWPVAYRMAREFSETHAVDDMLSKLSTTYQLPSDHALLSRPLKRFLPADNFVPVQTLATASSRVRQVA